MFERELQIFLRQQILERFWAKDRTLWSEELVERDPALAVMGWHSLTESLGSLLEAVRHHEQSADAEGLTGRALIGSESANLSMRARQCFPEFATGRQ